MPHLAGEVSVVGGAVRDALLGRPHLHDVDLVVEGDAIACARAVAHALGAPLTTHERFGTAVLELPHAAGHVDFISARRERYPAPGALPEIAPGTLADDLARRDFTINAMALRITGPQAGALVDPFGGARDLRDGVVRALREDAFTEDPSRIVRAARYAGRLGFDFAPATRSALEAAVPSLAWRAARPADELRRLLAEAAPSPGLGLLCAMGAPGVAPDSGGAIGDLDAAAARIASADPHAQRFPAWALRAGVALELEARQSLAVPGWARGVAEEVAQGPRLWDALERVTRPSQIDRVLAASALPTQIAALALGAPHILEWRTQWRDVRVQVRGADLIGAGIAPGPAIGRALAAVRAAVLDGEVVDPAGQRALAIRVATEAAA